MRILYETNDYVVLVKPRGVLSEAGAGGVPELLTDTHGTLFPVHRLDRGVGGVMVYARHKKAAAALCGAVTAGAMQKEYLAVAAGAPVPAAGEMRDLLFKDSRQNKSFAVKTPRRGAREAVLTYETLDVKTGADGAVFSLVRVRLCTGRSHQIRVQFASRGWPLVGDGKYGSRHKAAGIALFAARLTFPDPATGAAVSFAAPPPDEWPWTLFEIPSFEIERKFLIRMPDAALLAAQPGVRCWQIEQTYLAAPAGETRRVRRVECDGNVTLIETRKRAHAGIRCVEEERTLDAGEYAALLREADPTRHAVVKTRWRIPHGAQTVEVDIYPFWQDRAVAEVELSDEGEPCVLPPYLTPVRDVSEDKRYKNVNLAKTVPTDPL